VANLKNAAKKARQADKRRTRNIHAKSTLRTAIKKVRVAIEGTDLSAAQTALKEAVKTIDHYASKGVMHKNTASRTVARLSKAVHTLSQAA